MRTVAILSALLIVGCAGEPELSCETVSPINGVTSQSEMALYADDIVARASELRSTLSKDRGLVGFSGTVAKGVAGTNSYAFAKDLRHLERLLALQTAREQATRNDGPPLVDPSQPWACEMLAVSVASLDQGQSAEQLLSNLKRIERYYGPEYPYRRNSGIPE